MTTLPMYAFILIAILNKEQYKNIYDIVKAFLGILLMGAYMPFLEIHMHIWRSYKFSKFLMRNNIRGKMVLLSKRLNKVDNELLDRKASITAVSRFL